jgi:predicted TPR repeat methyltransferase
MNTYDIFLEYYDKIVRSISNPLEDEVEFLVEDCMKNHKPESKTILETACGTWEVARELTKKWYKVTGLDINEKMLKKAEANVSKSNLVLADMTNFDLKKKFDIILCNYNSVCHLLKWEQWQNFFDMSNAHLEKDWLLIFDINTLYEFESITNDFSQFYNFGEDTVCLEMNKLDWIFHWLVKIFKKTDDWNYNLIEEVIKENSFPINKIKKELNLKWFKILEMIDYHYWEVTAKSERVYFICKKK